MPITPICCELLQGEEAVRCCYSTLHFLTRMLELELTESSPSSGAGAGVGSASLGWLYPDEILQMLWMWICRCCSSAREFSSNGSCESHTGDRQHALMAKYIIFVDLILKMPLALLQLDCSGKPETLPNPWKEPGIHFFVILYKNVLIAQDKVFPQPRSADHSQKNPATFCLWTDASAEPSSDMVNRSRRLLVMGWWIEDVHLLLILGIGG